MKRLSFALSMFMSLSAFADAPTQHVALSEIIQKNAPEGTWFDSQDLADLSERARTKAKSECEIAESAPCSEVQTTIHRIRIRHENNGYITAKVTAKSVFTLSPSKE